MKVVLLGVDDWEALYIDGEKEDENHRLNLDQVLLSISKKYAATPNLTEFTYEHFYFEPQSVEENEEWEMGIFYEHKLKDVDPHLRQGIAV